MCCITHDDRDKLADMKGEKYERAPSAHFACQCDFGEPCRRTGTVPTPLRTGDTGFFCEWCAGRDHNDECFSITHELADITSRQFRTAADRLYADQYASEYFRNRLVRRARQITGEYGG